MRVYKILKYSKDFSSYSYEPYTDKLDLSHRSLESLGFTYINGIASYIDSMLIIDIDAPLTKYPELKKVSEEIKIKLREDKLNNILNEIV